MLPSSEPEPAPSPASEPVAPDVVWESLFARLAEYKQQHGHFLIAADAENELLALWVAQQRDQWFDGTMPPDRRQRLEAIGFPGGLQPHPTTRRKPAVDYLDLEDSEHAWRVKYKQLAEFRIRFGHCYVPHPWPEQPGLGVWVQAQRERRQDGNLDAEHIARLDELSFIWTGGWEVLGDDWRQKQKQVMGIFYHDPAAKPEHYTLKQYQTRPRRQEPVEPEADDIEI